MAKKGFFTSNYSYYIQPPKNVPTIKAGKSMFIDKVPYRIMLTTVNKDGLIYKGDFNVHFERYDYYNGFLEDEGKRVGKEKLLVRTVDLSPGLYAWVQMDEEWEIIGAIPEGNGSAFIFKVENTGTK